MKIRYGYKCGKELHRKKQMLRKKDKLAVSEKFVGADLVSAHRKA